MKKSIKWILAGLVIIAGIVLVINLWHNAEVGEFSLREYQIFIDQFPSDIVVDPVKTEKEVMKIAEDIWTDIYGGSVRLKKPYQVFYDADNKVWLVQGSLPFYLDGGVPYILIERESGRVLAVWHDK